VEPSCRGVLRKYHFAVEPSRELIIYSVGYHVKANFVPTFKICVTQDYQGQYSSFSDRQFTSIWISSSRNQDD